MFQKGQRVRLTRGNRGFTGEVTEASECLRTERRYGRHPELVGTGEFRYRIKWDSQFAERDGDAIQMLGAITDSDLELLDGVVERALCA
jgi:hypothetical protein